MNARLVQGGPNLMIPHVAAGDIAAGAVVVVGELPLIAHRDIAEGDLGALAAGGGMYEMPKATGGGSAIGGGVPVYWNAGSSVITATASTHKLVGYTAAASVDGDTHQNVIHRPGVVPSGD